MLAQSRIPRVLMLSVFRDGTLHGQAELTAQGLRIGRGSENDIVLEDAAKRVSRLHAELKLEADGAITLTDLRSANGTWIAGERVDTEALEPGVPFTIGPYRLMLEAFADSGAADYPSQSAPEPSVPPSLAQPAESVVQEPPPPAPRRRSEPAAAQGSWKSAAGLLDLALKHRWVTLIGGGAAVAIAGLGIWSMSGNASAPEHPPVDVATSTPTPGEPTPPPPDPHAAQLDAADRLLVQGDKASAETALRDHITPVLQADPTNARALEQKVVAERIIGPATTVVAPPPPGAPPPRLDVRQVDSRAVQHGQRLGDARAAFEKNDYKTALLILEDLLADAPENNEARALQAKVLAERSDTARRQISDAEELVKAGKLPEAIDAFRRAEGIDPTLNVSGRIAEVRQRMVTEGEAAFIDGINYAQAMRGDQAIPLLQKAWRYLPDGHRDKATVRSELARLGAPVR
jgi:tetratricopeptide (TPR) repeat protein